MTNERMRACEIRWVMATFPSGGPAYEAWMAPVTKHRGQAAAEDLRKRVRQAYVEAIRK